MKKSNKMITGKEEKVSKKEEKVLNTFFFPKEKISVEAESLKDAENKMQKIHSKK